MLYLDMPKRVLVVRLSIVAMLTLALRDLHGMHVLILLIVIALHRATLLAHTAIVHVGEQLLGVAAADFGTSCLLVELALSLGFRRRTSQGTEGNAEHVHHDLNTKRREENDHTQREGGKHISKG